jgi:hypothetical protein
VVSIRPRYRLHVARQHAGQTILKEVDDIELLPLWLAFRAKSDLGKHAVYRRMNAILEGALTRHVRLPDVGVLQAPVRAPHDEVEHEPFEGCRS